MIRSNRGQTVVRLALLAWLAAFGGPAREASAQVQGQGQGRVQIQVPVPDIGRQVPRPAYFAAIAALHSGDYRYALRDLAAESRGAIKTPQSSWIDSICYRAMLGETYYHMGNYAQALENYNAALQLYVAFSDWMLRVQFTQLSPDTGRARRPIAWGQSQRRFQIARVPDVMSIGQGQIGQDHIILQQGGVVQQAVLFPVNVQEIVRCTALSIRRRKELMGPVCKLDPLTGEVLARLQRRPGPANWSEAWIDLQLGLAHAAADELPQAQQLLQRSLLLGGEFDHPLTCVAMVELGKLALEQGDFRAAATWFEEATYSAFYFESLGVLEEAFRLGMKTHMMSNAPGVYPPLAHAAAWAGARRLRQLQVWLAALLAENHAALGQTAAAAAALNDARAFGTRRDMMSGVVGAQVNFTTALVAFQQGQSNQGADALATALAFQRTGSRWLFQLALADRLYASGTIAPRVALSLYQQLLRDPSAADWRGEPLESLSVLSISHPGSFEQWFDAALRRKEMDVALEVTDRARRHWFYSSLPLGGRLLALRWILEAPLEELPQHAIVQRQDLLLRYPKYDQLSQQAQAIRARLLAEPLVRESNAEAQEQGRTLTELGKISAAQETILHEIALSREAADLVFPPVVQTKDLKEKLAPRQAVLSFFATGGALHAFLVTKDSDAHWVAGSAAVAEKGLAKLLRDLGNYDENREIALAEIQSDQWQTVARQMLDYLMRESRVDLRKGIDELVIVPDGPLWYLPFEALPLGEGNEARPMISWFRMRYAPTVSLAVADARPRKRGANLAVVLGKLFPRDAPAVAEEAFEQIRSAAPGAVAMRSTLPAPSPLYAALVDRLIVLDDLAVEPSEPYGWTPITLDKSKGPGTLGMWLSLPWGGPQEIVLPGFHTAAEHAMKKKSGPAAGREVFLTVCGLMANGARTVLLSRWRTGGQTSIDLVRELVMELPHTHASDAWQRSVELAWQRTLDGTLEPRVKRFESDHPPTAAHPFFWAGYMLVDSGAPPQKIDDPEAEAVLKFDQPAAKERQKD